MNLIQTIRLLSKPARPSPLSLHPLMAFSTPAIPTYLPPIPTSPDATTTKPGLKVYNSLTKSKVDFVSREPNKVSWYNCGPTVYDASHMGHARNYVTQDVLRRIVRDYFGYDVKFVMNVTDIDDKIIQRARQQFLLENLRANSHQLEHGLLTQARTSWEVYFTKTVGNLVGNGMTYEQVLTKAELDPKWKAEMLAKEEKFGMWLDALATARQALDRASSVIDQSSSNSRAEAERLIDGASEVLSKWLDSQYGSTVTDHAIFKKLASYWEKSFFDDMSTLGVEPPTVLTRVSDYVEQIVDYVKKIIDRGFAYEHQGSVYFDVNAFDGAQVDDHPIYPPFRHSYAKLQPGSKSNKKLIEEGEGALSVGPTNTPAGTAKRSAADFALWKKSKPGEPGWESVWGSGRPGWHIECSVMAGAILGDGMDIHSGGVDLMFPHHDNELAQSEAYHNCPQWVNYFLHTGHLHIEGLKMSKSLKNFITISDALKQHSARQLRLAFLAQRWDLGMDFAESAMAEVRNQELTFNNFFAVVNGLRYERSLEDALGTLELKSPESSESPHCLSTIFKSAQSDFHAALCDSFNTPEAMKQLLNLVTETNKFISSGIPSIRSKDTRDLVLISSIAAWITRMLKLFGLEERSQSISDGQEDRTGDLIGWNLPDPTTGRVMAHLIEWSSFRDEARRTARQQMMESSSPLSFRETLIGLCETQYVKHCARLGVKSDDAQDSMKFFATGPDLDHLDEALRKTLSSHLKIWYEFWNEMSGLARGDEGGPKDVLKLCDRLRDERVVEVGVALDDQDDGRALVKLLPASQLIQAREEKQRLQRSKQAKQLAAAQEAEAKRVAKLMKGKLKAEEMFLGDVEFGEWDEVGIPIKMKDGTEVSKAKKKKLCKEWEGQKKLNLAFEEWRKSKGGSEIK